MRRTLSPVPRPGTPLGGESTSFTVASPLSKCSSCNTPTDPSLKQHSLYRFVLNLFLKTGYRSLDKQKPKSNSWSWNRSFFHFLLCFLVGVFIGFTPIVSITTSPNVVSRSQVFSFEQVDVNVNHVMSTHILNDSKPLMIDVKQENETSVMGFGKFLIIVTTVMRSRYYYLSRLAHRLKMVEPPLLWVVVEMTSQSRETSELLRRSGVMYRHLVCTLNTTEVKDLQAYQRNAALKHIEMHRLDGIVYFADDNSIYSAQLFHYMRQIRRFGTWQVAKLKESTRVATFVGPVCNGTQVIGWHTNNVMRRFHADISGFAFNSTILWDPKHSTRPIRYLDTVKELFQASVFIEQVVKSEAEMEGLPEGCSVVLVWNLPMEVDQLFSSNATILDPLSISM